VSIALPPFRVTLLLSNPARLKVSSASESEKIIGSFLNGLLGALTGRNNKYKNERNDWAKKIHELIPKEWDEKAATPRQMQAIQDRKATPLFLSAQAPCGRG